MKRRTPDATCPLRVEIYAIGGDAYNFLFIAKGGGSANKTYLYQETKAVLNPGTLVDFLTAKMKTLGTAACPPYHLAFVVGGTSAEFNLKTVKLASAGYLDGLPTAGSETRPWPSGILNWKRNCWHGRGRWASAPSSAASISATTFGWFACRATAPLVPSALASAAARIATSRPRLLPEAFFLEQLETDPARFLPGPQGAADDAVAIDLNQSMDDIRAILTRYPVATRLKLSGKIIVGRDIAHAKLKERLDSGQGLPRYLKDHIIYYAGPAKTPDGYASGSFGPTTAGRMDSYVPLFQAQGCLHGHAGQGQPLPGG